MKAGKMAIGAALVFGSALAIVGCSSSPDASQLRQLSDLKQEYGSLQKDVTTKEQQAKTLEGEIADKNAKLKKCHDDEQIVRTRLSSTTH